MAFDPDEVQNMNPYSMTSAQRLQLALASNKYGATQQGTAYGKKRVGIDKAFRKALPRAESGYAQRGVIDSGIRDVGVADMFVGRTAQRGEAREAMDSALYDMILNNMQSYGVYEGERFNTALAQAKKRADTAAQIREALG